VFGFFVLCSFSFLVASVGGDFALFG
jgi:hypothetical protein